MPKTGYFILEGLNSFGLVYYSYYLFFFMAKQFRFGNQANLALAALAGAIYMVSAWQGGKFAQRFGYLTALKLGFAIMIVTLGVGSQVESAGGQVLVMSGTMIGMCFTWPTLEALVSEGETRAGLQRMVGIYNVVWAGTGAVANFTGGAILEGLGLKSLFYVPLAILVSQLGLTVGGCRGSGAEGSETGQAAAPHDEPPPHPSPLALGGGEGDGQTFLRMAWLANPLAYLAINTLIAVMPGVARKLELSTMLAGFCGSVWCFARLGACVGLWFWGGWHYRFGWLLGAYLTLAGSFAVILLVPHLAAVVVAQIGFGLALGLIYYSSLYYSMDRSETKGEHGGIHEAAIGLGNFVGPAVGAAALHFLPERPNSGTLAVSGLLVLGLGGLLGIWRRGKRNDE